MTKNASTRGCEYEANIVGQMSSRYQVVITTNCHAKQKETQFGQINLTCDFSASLNLNFLAY